MQNKITTSFPLGVLLITQGALHIMTREEIASVISRHKNCDCGDLDDEDKQRNEQALQDGSRLFSAYNLPGKEKIWVITEAVSEDDLTRLSTTILLPSEY